MTQERDGSFICPQCAFKVKLQIDQPPEAWYNENDGRIVVIDDPSVPLCLTCKEPMTSVLGIRSLFGTRSLGFFCMKKGEKVHRLETYFRQLSSKEFAGLKQELKEAYELHMIWDLLENSHPIQNGMLEMDLSQLGPAERKKEKECLESLHAFGLVSKLQVSDTKIRFALDKGSVI